MGFFWRPWGAAGAGLAIAGGALALWFIENDSDALGLMSFLLRFVHVFAAMIWIGLIWFVNFIQLLALGSIDEGDSVVILRRIALPVATVFCTASHVVLATGLGLLLTTGYFLDRWVFPSSVYIPSLRSAFVWCGALAGLIMWGLANLVVLPNLKALIEGTGGPGEAARSRERLRLAARVNLCLAVPVTFVMVAAAHLF